MDARLQSLAADVERVKIHSPLTLTAAHHEAELFIYDYPTVLRPCADSAAALKPDETRIKELELALHTPSIQAFAVAIKQQPENADRIKPYFHFKFGVDVALFNTLSGADPDHALLIGMLSRRGIHIGKHYNYASALNSDAMAAAESVIGQWERGHLGPALCAKASRVVF